MRSNLSKRCPTQPSTPRQPRKPQAEKHLIKPTENPPSQSPFTFTCHPRNDQVKTSFSLCSARNVSSSCPGITRPRVCRCSCLRRWVLRNLQSKEEKTIGVSYISLWAAISDLRIKIDGRKVNDNLPSRMIPGQPALRDAVAPLCEKKGKRSAIVFVLGRRLSQVLKV